MEVETHFSEFADIADVEKLVHYVSIRRRFLSKHAIACPKCGTRQVQLLELFYFPEWKCRECKFKFVYEPLLLIKENQSEKED